MKSIKLAFTLTLLAFANQVLACPGCKDALATTKGGPVNPWGLAFNLSIFFMLGTVLSMVGALTFAMYRIARREESGNNKNPAPAAASKRKFPTKVVLPVLAALYVGVISWTTVSGSALQTARDNMPFLSDDTFKAAVSFHKSGLLVDFGAPWCANCRVTAPAFAQVSDEYADRIKCFNLNVDQNPKTAKALKVDDIPCLILYVNCKEVARRSGVATDIELRDWLAQNLPKQ